MTKEELAQQLDGCEYTNEMTPAQERIAKENGLVVVFGASDDLMEFRGAIYDEVGCYDGGEAMVNTEGLCGQWEQLDHDDIDAMRKFFKTEGTGVKIEALWAKEDPFSWTFKTAIPHATFIIHEGGEDDYCRGIVFALADAREKE